MHGTAVVEEMLEPLKVVVEIMLDCHQQRALIKANPPMQVAGKATQFERTVGIARHESQPLAGFHSHHHRTLGLEQQHCAIEQMLIPWDDDGTLGTAIGLRPQPMALRVGAAQGDEFDGAVMFKMMEAVLHVVIVDIAQDVFKFEHE